MNPDASDLVLAFVRWLLAIVLFVHGTQKSLGWFRGPGLHKAASVFATLGQRPPGAMVLLASICEVTAAVLLAIGLAVPLACAVAAGTMIVAFGSQALVTRTFAHGKGGGEYPAVLAALAVVISPSPGVFSLDHALGMPWTTEHAVTGGLVMAGVLVLAMIAAAPPLLMARTAVAPLGAAEPGS